ncbi:MAG: TetR/AcrR family transcriptional regulator [Rhodopirellula sp.]|nr:TetR/AcrR family transcriptional regulator [Rhodopirellula sp.]
MGTKKLEGEIRREQIVKAALELLGTRSVGELSMADIARRVGLVPSAIYRHFDGREAILDAIVDLIDRRLKASLEAVGQQPGRVFDKLRALLMRHVQFVRENHALPRIVFSDEMVSRNPARRARVYQVIEAYLVGVGELVRQGQAAGEIRTDLDPKTVAMLFLGIVQPGAVLWHLSDGQFDIARHAKGAWRQFRQSLAAEKG